MNGGFRVAIYSQKVLSLFSGTGGLDLAIKLALQKARTVCFIEREAYSCAVLVQRMQDGSLDDAPIWSDVTTFQGKAWNKKVDIIIGGFPCQPWSTAGKQKKTKDDRWIWPSIHKIIRQVEPVEVFLENVPGLCSGGLHHVIGSLAALGFDAEWGVFSGEQIGAPQVRERIFILGKVANSNGLSRSRKNSFCNDRNDTLSSRSLDNYPGKNLFPPRPGDKNKWEKIQKSRPLYKPAFFDLANGDASIVARCVKENWQKQIRTVGNGIIPITAAFAYTVLSDRLNACST